MKKIVIYLFIVFSIAGRAQQIMTYTQYLFNIAGMNPAASGININQKTTVVCGINRQWLNIPNSPKSNFINFSYTIRPPRSYRFWQNAGIYIDNDQSGIITSTGVYGSYTLHWLIRKKLVASFGIYGGARKYTRSMAGLDAGDPAVQKNAASVILYPDLIPGFRLSGKKFFTDISIRQVSINKLKDFKGRKIGSPSVLYPSVYLDYGRKIPLMDNLLMIPSLAVNLPVIGPPAIDANVMWYYATRIGGGFGLRNVDLASAILQIRFLENMTVGMAYTYPINATRYAAQTSFELMIGMIPMGMTDKSFGKHSVAKCPTLDY